MCHEFALAMVTALGLTLALVSISGCHGLTEADINELRCVNPFPPTTPDLDVQWLLSVDKWYYTWASALDVYRTAEHILKKKIPDLNHKDDILGACSTFSMFPPRFIYKGIDYPFEWEIFPNKTFAGKGTTSSLLSIPITDNKSFVFFYSCWEDGEASAATMTTGPELSGAALKATEDYAKSIGFHAEKFIPLPFENCAVEEGWSEASTSGEVPGKAGTSRLSAVPLLSSLMLGVILTSM